MVSQGLYVSVLEVFAGYLVVSDPCWRCMCFIYAIRLAKVPFDDACQTWSPQFDPSIGWTVALFLRARGCRHTTSQNHTTRNQLFSAASPCPSVG